MKVLKRLHLEQLEQPLQVNGRVSIVSSEEYYT